MVDASTKKDIERISMDVLKQSKALDVFPTPVDRIVNCANLVVSGSVDLVHINESFLSKIPSYLRKAAEGVRGILNREQKTIYLDLSQLPPRKNFVSLHETGHELLEWQGATAAFLENDTTLDPDTKEQFEAEANYFASETLFQQDRFLDAVKNFGIGITPARAIGKQFGASIHATLRRIVEKSEKRVALLVLKQIPGSLSSCEVRNTFVSKAFERNFGTLVLPQELTSDYKYAGDYLRGRVLIENGASASVPTTTGMPKLDYQYFNNRYNAFILFYPEGELPKAKTKIIAIAK